MTLSKRSLAEFIGTFWLVFGGCGSAVLAAAFPNVGIGMLWRLSGFWIDRADDGLCYRTHLRLSSQSGCFPWSDGGPAISRSGVAGLYCCTSSGRYRRRRCVVFHRQRQAGFRHC